jgi:hypothetical protein
MRWIPQTLRAVPVMFEAPALDVWMATLLLSLIFLPPMRLAGQVPFRVDDIVAFGGGAVLISGLLIKGKLPRLDGISAILLLMAFVTGMVTFLVGSSSHLSVGTKEYLDVLRPLKFMAVYLVVQRIPYDRCLKTLQQVLSVSLIPLVGLAIAQFLLLKPSSTNLLATFSLSFTELDVDQARSYFGLRSFSTFHTPTDLGYVATFVLMASLALRELPHRRRTAILAALGVLLSGTRTFIFGIPIMLIGFSVFIGSGVREKFRRLCITLILLSVGALSLLVIIPSVSPDFAENTTRSFGALTTGSFDQDQSILTRLQNLQMVLYTWEHAPYFGVVSRDLLTTAADSEYILTFHRYGLAGILQLVLFYWTGLATLRVNESRREMQLFALFALLVTGLYGVTQGALINTRVGVLVFVVLGVLHAKLPVECADSTLFPRPMSPHAA